MAATDPTAPDRGSALLAMRGAIGGILMGLANLVPGISGGTMLLAAGVYPGFISAIAEITTLRFRARSLVLLGTVVGAAALAILLLAGAVKALVEDHRWLMYSLFIGLTLGGVPMVWRMARPASAPLVAGAVGAFAAMLVMALANAGASGSEGPSTALLVLSGLAASSAMILPGVSGGYLLLLLGQYEAILGTIDQVKRGLLGDASGDPANFALILDAMNVLVPLAFGIAAGVVGVSNLLRWLLVRYPKPTLGALLGLLLGAVVGLWPFQRAEPPQPGDVVKGRLVTVANAASFDPEDWPLGRFDPSPAQSGTALGLIGLGFGATVLIGRLGREEPERNRPASADSPDRPAAP